MVDSSPVRFVTAPTAPRLARAVSVALAVLRHTKARTWAELAARIDSGNEDVLRLLAGIELDDDQQALLDQHTPVLGLVSAIPLTTVAVCPQCSGWVLASAKSPTRCTITTGCAGKPVKASVAPKAGSKAAGRCETVAGMDDGWSR